MNLEDFWSLNKRLKFTKKVNKALGVNPDPPPLKKLPKPTPAPPPPPSPRRGYTPVINPKNMNPFIMSGSTKVGLPKGGTASSTVGDTLTMTTLRMIVNGGKKQMLMSLKSKDEQERKIAQQLLRFLKENKNDG